MADKKPDNRAPSTPTVTDETLLGIAQDSQEFAELTMADKLRFFQLQAASLRAQNQKLTEALPDADGLRLTDKGCLSFAMAGSWPATYYRDQWLKIIAVVKSGAVERFLAKEPKIVNKPPKEKK